MGTPNIEGKMIKGEIVVRIFFYYKDMMFDDTFAHKVYNNTDEIRVVIYMDIARPFLKPGLKEFNEMILGLFENNSSVKNEISRTEYQIDLTK